jgi:hypothetical protein
MKTLLGLILILTISNCSTYKPIIDTKGRAGTWNEARAVEITDDIHHCRMLAEQHLSNSTEFQSWIIDNILRPASLGVVGKAEDTKKNYIKKCLAGRNHNVIN